MKEADENNKNEDCWGNGAYDDMSDRLESSLLDAPVTLAQLSRPLD